MSPAKSPHATKRGYVNASTQAGPDPGSPMARQCPYCGVAPGMKCRRLLKSAGYLVAMKTIHPQRRRTVAT